MNWQNTQEVCPWNSPKLVQVTSERDTRPEWDLWTRGSAIRRAGYEGFRRNVAVAMGNWLASRRKIR